MTGAIKTNRRRGESTTGVGSVRCTLTTEVLILHPRFMTQIEDLRTIRTDLVSLLSRVDQLIEVQVAGQPKPKIDITGLQRTKAIEWVLEDCGEVMRPIEIWRELQAHGRNDPKMEVQVTTYDLAERRRIEKVGRGQYKAGAKASK